MTDISDMTPEEVAIADDFEKGWSEERLDAAGVRWGPGITEIFPHGLTKKIHERARHDGISDLELIQRAVPDYLRLSG